MGVSSVTLWRLATATVAVFVLCGCTALRSQSGPPRDPLVMSHLTHSKEDPLFAGSENGPFPDPKDDPIRSATVARKLDRLPEIDNQSFRNASLRTLVPEQQPEHGHASDFRWLVGRVMHRDAPRAGWYLRYAPHFDGDRHGGEIALAENHRLTLLRDGDRVFVEGRVIDDRPGAPVYHVESLSVISP